MEGAHRKWGSVRASHRYLAAALSIGVGMLLWAAPAFATAPAVEEASVLEVTSESAELQAQINPEGNETTYRFEYGTTEAYGASLPIPDGSLGSGSVGVTVTVEPQGLAPNTTYYYRVVATVTTSAETVEEVGTFTTQSAGGEFGLPDGRAWEMVSPPNKHGATIYPLGEAGVIQAAEDGGAITYLTNAPIEGEPKGAYSVAEQMLSRRGTESWSSRDIVTPHDESTGLTAGIGLEYRFFSTDLSRAVVEPQGDGKILHAALARRDRTHPRPAL